MQVAVLSDIHSNYRALEAVLAECEKRQIKDYLFLGANCNNKLDTPW